MVNVLIVRDFSVTFLSTSCLLLVIPYNIIIRIAYCYTGFNLFYSVLEILSRTKIEYWSASFHIYILNLTDFISLVKGRIFDLKKKRSLFCKLSPH